MFPKIKWKIEL